MPNPIWGGQEYGGGFGIFDAIAAMKPDLMLWVGDNLYFQKPDEFDPASMAMRYQRQRTFPPLQKLLTAAPHLATWDDHDYGPNNADTSYVMKGDSLQLFRRYWANPSYGLPDVPGIFGHARWGDVDILPARRPLVPLRQSTRATDPTRRCSARSSWRGCAMRFIRSQAPIKFVVNGSQMWNRVNRFEGWNHFATEQRAFADWLLAQRIDGVVFLSGDRHFSELLKVNRPGAYPLYEFTSSPLTSRPWANPDAAEQQNGDVVPGTLIGKRQFGMLRVTGPGNDRVLALESYDEAGNRLWRNEIRARDLRMPKSAGSPLTAPRYERALVWFRRDLRDFDHAALYHALKDARSVHCAFVFDRDILDALPRPDDRRVEFIHDSVVDLAKCLAARGGALIVRHGVARDEIPRLAGRTWRQRRLRQPRL